MLDSHPISKPFITYPEASIAGTEGECTPKPSFKAWIIFSPVSPANATAASGDAKP